MSGLSNIYLGDNRFLNNIFVKQDNGRENIEEATAQFYGLHGYKIARLENISDGNVYYNGAKPDQKEINFIEKPNSKLSFEIVEEGVNVYLNMKLDSSIFEVNTSIVTTKKLGTTIMSEAIYENPDGSHYTLNKDLLGNKRNEKKPLPGRLENIKKAEGIYKIW